MKIMLGWGKIWVSCWKEHRVEKTAFIFVANGFLGNLLCDGIFYL